MITEELKIKAALTNDIRLLLIDYFYFRAAIKFKNKKLLTCYGHEHRCTYKQILTGRIKEIVLTAELGYTSLIKYIEEQAKLGQIKSAKIYSRDEIEGSFDTTHRRWFGGDWEEINDPLIPPERNIRILDFDIVNRRIEIKGIKNADLPANSGTSDSLDIDFKAEIAKALKEVPAKMQDHSIY